MEGCYIRLLRTPGDANSKISPGFTPYRKNSFCEIPSRKHRVGIKHPAFFVLRGCLFPHLEKFLRFFCGAGLDRFLLRQNSHHLLNFSRKLEQVPFRGNRVNNGEFSTLETKGWVHTVCAQVETRITFRTEGVGAVRTRDVLHTKSYTYIENRPRKIGFTHLRIFLGSFPAICPFLTKHFLV